MRVLDSTSSNGGRKNGISDHDLTYPILAHLASSKVFSENLASTLVLVSFGKLSREVNWTSSSCRRCIGGNAKSRTSVSLGTGPKKEFDMHPIPFSDFFGREPTRCTPSICALLLLLRTGRNAFQVDAMQSIVVKKSVGERSRILEVEVATQPPQSCSLPEETGGRQMASEATLKSESERLLTSSGEWVTLWDICCATKEPPVVTVIANLCNSSRQNERLRKIQVARTRLVVSACHCQLAKKECNLPFLHFSLSADDEAQSYVCLFSVRT